MQYVFFATESLLPGETADHFTRHTYTMTTGGHPGHYTCFTFSLFRRRLTIELRRKPHHEYIHGSTEADGPTGGTA